MLKHMMKTIIKSIKIFELLDNYNLDSVNAESIPRAGYAYLGIYLNGNVIHMIQ